MRAGTAGMPEMAPNREDGPPAEDAPPAGSPAQATVRRVVDGRLPSVSLKEVVMRLNVLLAFAVLLVCLVAGVVDASRHGRPDHLEVKSLTVQEPGSPYRLDMWGSTDGAGFSIQGGQNCRGVIAICDKTGSYVGLRNDESDGTCDIALAVDRHDSPRVQLVVDGKVMHIHAERLREMARSTQ